MSNVIDIPVKVAVFDERVIDIILEVLVFSRKLVYYFKSISLLLIVFFWGHVAAIIGNFLFCL